MPVRYRITAMQRSRLGYGVQYVMKVELHDELIARQYNITSNRFKILRSSFQKLGMPMSERHNAVYGCNDILDVLIKASERNTFVESLVRHNRLQDTGARTPDADLVMSAVRGVEPADVQAWCARTLARTVRHACRAGMLQDIDAIAIDVTDIPYHGEQLQEHTRKSRPRAGTSTFLSYVAVHGVGRDSSQIVLESKLLPAKEKLADFIAKTRTKILRGGAHSKTVFLYDRAFYNVDCMTEAGKGGCRYIMPVIMNSKIKRIVKMYKDGKASQVSQQSMTNKDGVTVTYNLVIVKRDRKKKKKGEGEEEGEEQYIAFATNIPIRSARAMTGIIPEQYRKRWGIETGFRVIKEIMGRTCSNSLSVRLLMFYLPLLLYNLWRIARFCLDAGKRHGRASSAGKKLTMALFIVYITSRNELFVNDRGK